MHASTPTPSRIITKISPKPLIDGTNKFTARHIALNKKAIATIADIIFSFLVLLCSSNESDLFNIQLSYYDFFPINLSKAALSTNPAKALYASNVLSCRLRTSLKRL